MTQAAVVRLFLLGLPVGLIVGGIASFGIWFHLRGKAERYDTILATMLRQPVNQEALERHVTVLAGTIGERHMGRFGNLAATANYLDSSLGPLNMGYDVNHQTYQVAGKEVSNIEVTLRGTRRPGEIIVVGAHYDTVPGSPGANDNGTGVAALLALAHAFAGDPQERTIRFVAFVNEEVPFFRTDRMGSYVYARAARQRGDNIVAMISLETMGYFTDEPGTQKFPDGIPPGLYPDRGNFIAFVGNEASAESMTVARDAFRDASDVPVEMLAAPEPLMDVAGLSDQWAFWQFDYPGFMITDTAPFRYPHYHLETDTPDQIDFETLTAVVKGIEASIRALANP